MHCRLKLKCLACAMLFATAASPLSAQRTYDPFQGSGAGGSTAAKAQVATGEFVDAPIGDVFRVVSDLTGWSIIMSPGVIARQPRVNLWLKDMPPEQVMRQVVNLAGLVYHRQGTLYHVMTFDEYSRLFGVRRQVRQLEHMAASDVVQVLQPFLDGDEASRAVASESGNQIVLLAPERMLEQLLALVEAIDIPAAQDRIEIVRLDHLDARTVVPLLEQFLTRSVGVPGRNAGASRASRSAEQRQSADAPESTGDGGAAAGKAGESLLVQFMVAPELNAVVVRGLPGDVTRAVALLNQLDQPSGREIRSYQLQYTNAAQVKETVERLLEGETGERQSASRPRVGFSDQNNRVVVEATQAEHERLRHLIEAIDQPLPAGAGDIRVYRLENSTAAEVTAVLESILAKDEVEERRAAIAAEGAAGAVGAAAPDAAAAVAATPATGRGAGGTLAPVMGVNAIAPRVTAAQEINAVIVRASAGEHESLMQVIQNLDQPRDQVMIEVTLVTVSATDSFNLGIELGGALQIDDTDVVGFSTFGTSEVDPVTGLLEIADPSPFGANVGIINGDDFSMVINALQTLGDVRISSAPKVLVEDNASAAISQLNEEPFEVTSQGGETTVTSFGGFVEAGTELQVIPHVSQDDWLRLEYEVSLSSFGTRTAGQLAANLPPPRTVNRSGGVVRIPSGSMVVLGGLAATRESESIDAVPLLADVPLIGELFKNRSSVARRDTLFIFIRPVLLRDPKFEDLVLLSREDLTQAEVSDEEIPQNPLKLFEASIESDRGPVEVHREE